MKNGEITEPTAETPVPNTPQLVADNQGLIAVNIGKSFKKRPVLRGVSLALQRGEAVGLLRTPGDSRKERKPLPRTCYPSSLRLRP